MQARQDAEMALAVLKASQEGKDASSLQIAAAFLQLGNALIAEPKHAEADLPGAAKVMLA